MAQPDWTVERAAKVCPVFKTIVNGGQPEPHTAAAAHRALYRETAALLADLNTATENATDPLAMAGTYCGIIAQHIVPLRTAIADVEFYEQAERVMDALFRERA